MFDLKLISTQSSYKKKKPGCSKECFLNFWLKDSYPTLTAASLLPHSLLCIVVTSLLTLARGGVCCVCVHTVLSCVQCVNRCVIIGSVM